MPKYSMINDDDGNEQVELEARTELEALYEALEILGWGLVVDDEE